MMNIDDALEALPDTLSWLDAIKSYGDEAISLWRVSGRVSANEPLTGADRHRLAYAITKNQQTSPKEDNTMPNNEAADISMFSDENRPYLIAAQKHRAKLQKSDTKSIFDIAVRLKEMIETKRAADAQRRPKEAVVDANAHRAGWRFGTADARPKNRQEEKEESGDDEDENEKALSDARREHEEYLATAYRQGR